jgi:hypothetical protein
MRSFVVSVSVRYTVKSTLLDSPPPGPGLKTETGAAPAVARSLAGIAAVKVTLSIKVVARSDPFQRTTDNEEKPDPLTASVNPEDPAALALGFNPVTEGTGSDANPVPDKFTVCGLPGPSLTIVRAPLRCPSVAGENVTEIEQLLPTFTVGPQLLVWENSSVVVIDEIESGAPV